ncbi:MAG TPA: N-acetyl-gamma-glutamyl-phosphate reductase, partial [Bacillota bacterium]|nr:N-acetyl-gamma-glutamyl-phosphate reductase [Bacillota bacterium]
MKTRVFINGGEGTTGLRIVQRLSERDDITLVTIDPDRRKDDGAVRKCMSESDITFFCLPDDAARNAAALAEGLDVRIIDASTAHRTQTGWVYGFPELGFREKIRTANRVAVPGCHASGFISLVKPLRDAGVIAEDAFLSCFSLTGYSGGGKKMIVQYETPERDALLEAPQSLLDTLWQH